MCAYITQKALMAHNTQQHGCETTWEKATLAVHLGKDVGAPTNQDPVVLHEPAREEFPKRKDMSIPEANIVGREWREKGWADWESGVKEKYPTRAEAKRIAQEGSFRKCIQEDINPYWNTFDNCDFDAQEGLLEMGWQIQRSKIRAVRKSGGTMFGPKNVADAKEMERRRVVAEDARVQYELLKSMRLILDAITC
jgi:hypothetical protein